MAVDPEMHDELPEKPLRRQLAATVRTIQWSYAIFWSTSTRQPGVLSWSDGYYNGDIKTRKTTQSVELKADQMGLQRSEQLRELYESLSAGDSNQQMRRPCASLSPEDLTHTEWYYLVCMSFTFTPGQGLPGKAFANNQHEWLSNAQFADSRIFSRSLLAKSASIQTVACIPFMGGVLELGTTESILEDAAVVTQITSFFWELPFPVRSEQSMSSPQMADDDDDDDDDDVDDVGNPMALEDHNLITDHPIRCPFALHSFPPSEQREAVHDKAEEVHTDHLCDCSPGDSFHSQQLEDMLEIDGLNCVSQTQNRQFRDDELISLNSNEYASMSVVRAKRVATSDTGERTRHPMLGNSKHVLLDLDAGDSHYANTVATILRSSKPVRSVSCFLKISSKSSFMVWRRGMSTPKPFTGTPQKLLKKMLMDGEWLRGGHQPKCQDGNDPKAWRPGESGSNHVLSERRSGEKLNEKFLVLQSLIPSVTKVDKASILGDTIEYLKDMERRVQELESCRESSLELDAKNRRKHPDVAERTSDNYGSKEMMANGRKSCSNKRKTCDAGETEAEHHWVLSRDGPIDVIVTMKEAEVVVEIHCPWRECLLLEIVESISHFHLDPLSVQSSTVDGVLALTVKSKFRSAIVASPGMIKRSLHRVIGKCL
uniref:BHLH domain-containing protein n=1 Tax=Musa acuminata subsp. malaccensis TaxID=214687 RepID=A0A804L8E0_MUSAM|nr:PREDICTED: transcription factor EGL1-like [Musa acuminata subsp. malaccensis]